MRRAAGKYHLWILIVCCLVLTLLWLPGLRYPVVSDTALYAELGGNLWTFWEYVAQGATFARHPPLHAFLSYPFVALVGINVGMKIATLVAGFGVLLFSYWLLRQTFGAHIAILSVIILTFHHGFVLMTQLGSADLLFSALFIGSLAAYSAAARDTRQYITAGALAGLATITRYNGAPLIPLFLLYTVFARRRDLTHISFITGMAVSILPLALWFLRNFLVFGSAFHSDFTGELERNSAGMLTQLLSNIIFYINPLHTILPILFLMSLYGMYRHGRQQIFLMLGMATAMMLTVIWWVQAMRFAFPAYPILIGFGVSGFLDLFRSRIPLIVGIIAIIASHLSILCFYAYGQCNAFVDRWKIPGIPANLHITPEGFYAWSLMRDELNRIAPQKSSVYVDSLINERAWKDGVFRSDILVVTEPKSESCPLYHISQTSREGELIIAKTEEAPVTYLTLLKCK